MSNNYFTPLPTGEAANAAKFNAPLGDLDAAITALDTRIDDIEVKGYSVVTGNVATLTNGAASAGQKSIVVDSSSGFIVGGRIAYVRNDGNSTIEYNTIDAIPDSTHLTCSANIGASGIADNSYVSLIPASEYQAAQAVNHGNGYEPTLQTALRAVGAQTHYASLYGCRTSSSASANVTALNALITAAAAGSTIVLDEVGTYQFNDALFIEKPLTIRGTGSGTVCRFVTGGTVTNQNAFWFRSAMDSDSASAKVYGPAGGVTYYRTFSGAVAEGARQFTLASATGLAPGTPCMLLLGVDPYDSTQPHVRMWNTVYTVAGSVVSFVLPVPEDINGTSHKVVTFDDIVENCGIENLTIDYDGTFSFEVAIWFDKCRNVFARNINLSGLPRGVVVEGSDNVTLENIHATSITEYAFLGGWGFTNLYARNLSVEDSYNTAVYFESQGRGAVLDNVRIGRGITAATGSASVMVVGACTDVVLKNFHLTHAVACRSLEITEGAEARTEDWFLYNSEYHREMPLRQHRGLLFHNEKFYRTERHFSRRFPLFDGMALDIGLPSGVYKDVRVYVTNTTNFVQFSLSTGGGNIASLLTANQLVRPNTKALTYIGKDADYPFNNTEAHSTIVQCSSMPAGAYGIIEIDYYEPSAADDDTQRGLTQALPIFTGTATWDVGSLADGESAATQLTVTGANVGCPCAAGLSTISTGNWQISAYCYSADAVRVVVTNHTGGTVDLASGTLRVIALQMVG